MVLVRASEPRGLRPRNSGMGVASEGISAYRIGVYYGRGALARSEALISATPRIISTPLRRKREGLIPRKRGAKQEHHDQLHLGQRSPEEMREMGDRVKALMEAAGLRPKDLAERFPGPPYDGQRVEAGRDPD